MPKNVSDRNLCQFYWLNKCEITYTVTMVIVDRSKMLIKDFNDRFGDLKAINFPSWLTQSLLVDVSDAAV